MKLNAINSSDAPGPVGAYSQAVELTDFNKLVFISGQVPVDMDDKTPTNFEDQCALTWKNVIAQLHAAGMDISNIVKVNIFVASRQYLKANREVREKILGDHKPSMSVVIADIFDEEWLLEIEAIAAQ